MQIDTKTTLNLVIGSPLTHSQSPLLHGFVYEKRGLNAVLLAASYPELPPLITAIKTLGVALTAVTAPYKEKVLPYLDVLSPEVEILGAANTLIQKKGSLKGYNTDIDGIAFALREFSLEGRRVLVLGAGGAARAAGYFLKERQAQISWFNRSFEKAACLKACFGGRLISMQDLERESFDLIINATSLGLYPASERSPLLDYPFSPEHLVFDMVYHPVMTLLLRQAKAAGAKIISGLDMFIGQGLKQIELLADCQLDVSELLEPLRRLLLQNQ